jgi:hypothetical protein
MISLILIATNLPHQALLCKTARLAPQPKPERRTTTLQGRSKRNVTIRFNPRCWQDTDLQALGCHRRLRPARAVASYPFPPIPAQLAGLRALVCAASLC